MDDVIAFARDLIAAEFDALVAKFTEPDEARFGALVAGLQTRFDYEIQRDFQRNADDPSFFDKGARAVERMLAPRTLFQVKAYRCPDHPTLFRVYVGPAVRSRSAPARYSTNFYLAPSARGLRVIARYDVQMTDRGMTLITSGGVSWLWMAGEKLSSLGDLAEVRKIEPPDDPAHRAEYEAE